MRTEPATNLTLILIANEEQELFEPLNARLTSRLKTATRIEFDRYNTEELVETLEPRVRRGLRENALTTEQLEMVSEAVAGDARVGLEVLRVASHRANQQGMETVSDEMVLEATPEAKEQIRQRNAEILTTVQRILYGVINEHGEISPSNLYEAYQDQADDPKSNRMVRNSPKKMERYNLVRSEGQTRGRTYHSIQ